MEVAQIRELGMPGRVMPAKRTALVRALGPDCRAQEPWGYPAVARAAFQGDLLRDWEGQAHR